MGNTVKKGAQKNDEADDEMLIDKRTGGFLGTETDYNCYKNKF